MLNVCIKAFWYTKAILLIKNLLYIKKDNFLTIRYLFLGVEILDKDVDRFLTYSNIQAYHGSQYIFSTHVYCLFAVKNSFKCLLIEFVTPNLSHIYFCTP